MSVDLASPENLPETCNSKDSSPVSTILAEENYTSLQMSSAEALYSETAVSPLPSSMDQLAQDSPDSSTSPKIKPLASASEKSLVKKEGKGQGKKQKVRTVFSQTQLCVLKDRFQKQKYLSLQQMQELSEVLNLSYKQVKTWFQNQRMKCKRWQKNTTWSKNGSGFTQKILTPNKFLELCSSYHQGCLPSGNLPMWNNQTWNNPVWSNQTWNNSAWSNQTWNTQAWSNQTWNSQAWGNHSWNSQAWCTQSWNSQSSWNNQFQSCGEEFLLPQIQFQPNSVSDLETSQALDLFLNYSMNMQPEDV